MAIQLLCFNGAGQTTAAPAKVTTGTAIKTMLQVKPLIPCKVIEWGCSFDGSAAATPGEIELITSGAVAATVTANAAGDTTQWNAAAQLANANSTFLSYGTTATGYTASGEGSVTATETFDAQLIAPTNQYLKQFPLGREPELAINSLLRVRMTFAAAINAYCYVILEF